MKLFKEKSEKKSLLVTTILSVAMILALLFFGLSYMEPPIENGITIRFGTSEVGAGDQLPEPIAQTPVEKPVAEEPESIPEELTPEETPEEVVTQTTEEAPVLKKEKEQDRETKTEEAEKQPEKKPEPKPDQATEDALQNILKGSKSAEEGGGGAGDDEEPGDKGGASGDPDSDSYYGQGKGLDGDGNYRLGGRRALSKTKYEQDCNETGTVVVEIKVDQTGKVIRATPGAKGTTNTNSCLTEPARRAALDTRFNSDANAPSVQTGFIIYVFKLSD